MSYTEKDQAQFTQAHEVHVEFSPPYFRDVRADLHSIFAWQDAYAEAWRRGEANPAELERFIRQAHFLREQHESQGGVGEWSSSDVVAADVGRCARFGPTDEGATSDGLFEMGQQVEIRLFDTWLSGVVDKVNDEGWGSSYDVTYEGGSAPNGSTIQGSFAIGVRPSELRAATKPQNVRGAITTASHEVRGFKVGQAVELHFADNWFPAKIERIDGQGDNATFGVLHGDLKSLDGARTTSAGTSFLIRPDRLRRVGGDVGDATEENEKSNDVGWWPGFGPSDEAKHVFALASQRLNDVSQWNVPDKLPHRRRTFEDVLKYQHEWRQGKATIAHLGGFKNDVESLAKEAAEKGFKIVGGPLPAIDVESVSSANKAAAGAVAFQKEVTAAARETTAQIGDDLLSVVSKTISAIPIGWKIGGGIALFGALGLYANSAGKKSR